MDKRKAAGASQKTQPEAAEVAQVRAAPAVAKHQQVRAALEEEIRAGRLEPGEQLPAERDLAQQFGVSYMTARRAVAELVESELVERRARAGTFVRSNSRARLALTTVHLVAPHFDSSGIKDFLRLGARAVEARGWRSHIIRLSPGAVRAAVRALENGDMMVLLPEGPELDSVLGEALARASGRAVVLGNRFDHRGVPSILADDRRAIVLAVEHLQSAGHSRIALLSNHPSHAVDREQIAAWRAACDPKGSDPEGSAQEQSALERRLIVVDTPEYECVAEFTYGAVYRFLTAGGDATALVSTSDEMSLAALAACRDAGRAVPERFSLINSGDSAMMAYAHPPVTCIDIHLERHIEQALLLLQSALHGELPETDRLRLIEPHLIERRSVMAPPAE